MKFLRSLSFAGIIAALCVSLAILPLAGCPQQATLAALTNTLGTAAASIATLEGNNALAVQLTQDTQAATAAITNWKTGSPATVAIEALSIVEADLNLIPGTSQYAPLIDIAIATVQSILSLLPASPATTATVAHVRTVHLGYPAPAKASDFKKRWNDTVAANPKLAAARIK